MKYVGMSSGGGHIVEFNESDYRFMTGMVASLREIAAEGPVKPGVQEEPRPAPQPLPKPAKAVKAVTPVDPKRQKKCAICGTPFIDESRTRVRKTCSAECGLKQARLTKARCMREERAEAKTETPADRLASLKEVHRKLQEREA